MANQSIMKVKEQEEDQFLTPSIRHIICASGSGLWWSARKAGSISWSKVLEK